MQSSKLFSEVENLQPQMVQALIELNRIPAVAPENGGNGEFEKGEQLSQLLTTVGFDKLERYDADDTRVTSGKRPNIVATLNGETPQRLWIITHLDVVPAGEESLWKLTKPFEPIAVGDKVFGRGCEDNGQSIVASLFAIVALKRLGIRPKRTICLAFVADEEQGSMLGIQHLIKKGLFHQKDLIIVPDGGNASGGFIEVSEKSLFWFRIRTIGKQTHGSLPNKGLNAHRVGMQVALALDERLHQKFGQRDDFFDFPLSTFEPTKKERNVEAVNIIPGEDVVCFDCRILPTYDVDEVVAEINRTLREFEQKTGAKITLEIIQKEPAPNLVAKGAEIVTLLKTAIKNVRGIDATVGGIGGGSCAAYFRKQGIPAALWSTVDEVMHQPDEYSRIANMVADAKIYATLAVM